jgi:hypothetical protein
MNANMLVAKPIKKERPVELHPPAFAKSAKTSFAL